ncbi:M23 family metallopeptidase [Spirochaetia bacterium 38H-sp]|uniref:M23 family metallopeptidase n=1 Tax=Rarispira pelagica TaxID=3141764 RepID=A0ABU9UD34_9SPIR
MFHRIIIRNQKFYVDIISMIMLKESIASDTEKKGLLYTATFMLENKYIKVPGKKAIKRNTSKKNTYSYNNNLVGTGIKENNKTQVMISPKFVRVLYIIVLVLFFVLIVLFAINNALASEMLIKEEESDRFLSEIVSNYVSYGSFFEKPEPAYVEVDPSQFSSLNVQEYTIKQGDTLYDIAKKFNLRLDTIISFNTMSDVRRIPVNTTIHIPDRNGVLYTVNKGDSLESIAKKYGISMISILDANDLSTDKLKVGQKLFLPDAKMSSFELKKALGELFIYPIKGRLTSSFGMRTNPFTGKGPLSFHNGIDIANPIGTPVKAALAGKIVRAGTHSIYGKYVIISHYGGFQTLYGHMSRILVKSGQYVSQGQKIGEVGNTGYSSGPHLHFSVFKNGKAVDPLKYLR